MASKDQKRGSRELRKPKQVKTKPAAAAASPFVVTAMGKAQQKQGRKP